MNVPDGPMRERKVSKDSKLIKAYVWLYDADLNNTNFCKLFWAAVFSPLMLILTGLLNLVAFVGRPVVALVKAIARKLRLSDEDKAKKNAEFDAWLKAKKEKKLLKQAAKLTKGKSWQLRFLSSVADHVDALVGWLQDHGKFVKKIGRGIKVVAPVVAIILVAAAVLTGLGFLVAVIVTNVHQFLYVLGIVGLSVVGAAVLVGLIYLATEVTDFGENVFNAIVDALCWIGRGFKAVGRFLRDGHHAIKYRTCPRITIVEGK